MKISCGTRPAKISIFAFIALCWFSSDPASAESVRRLEEEPEIETSDAFSSTVQGGVGGLIGSVDSAAFSLGGSMIFRGAKWRQMLSASSLLTAVDTPHGRYGRELQASYRFRFLWLPRFSNFAGGGVSQRTTSGQKFGVGGNIGASLHFFPNHPRNIRWDAGYSPSYRKSTSGGTSRTHSIFTSITWEEPFAEHWQLSQSVFTDINTQEAEDYSFESVQTLAYAVKSNVSINLSLTTTYDRQPTSGFKRLNFLILPACVFAF